MTIYKHVISILLLVGIDQLSKFFILDNLIVGDVIPVNDFFNITHILNHGSGFGFLSGETGWQVWFLIIFAIIVLSYLFLWLQKSIYSNLKMESAMISVLIAGGIGNLIDRIYHGFVIDFISIHYKQNYFPVFNIADIMISLGAITLIIISLRYK